jgi:hypothetical protein
MSDALTSPAELRGGAAPSAAHWLSLAATPTFAVMALWTAAFSPASSAVCGSMQSASPLGGMAVMYVLMSAFHLNAWLRLLRRA